MGTFEEYSDVPQGSLPKSREIYNLIIEHNRACRGMTAVETEAWRNNGWEDKVKKAHLARWAKFNRDKKRRNLR